MQRSILGFGLSLSVFAAQLAPATVSAASAAPANEDICFSNWSDAAPIVARERLIPARDVQEMSRRQLPGDVVRITLCREEAGYVYLLLLRDGQGRISNLKIDAHVRGRVHNRAE